MNSRTLLLCVASLIYVPSALTADVITPVKPTALWDGHTLNGWTQVVRSGSVPDAGTWTVGDGVIKCSGQPAGYIRTEQAYRNYRLTVEWRWAGSPLAPDAKGRPRLRNSGVLVHTQIPDAVWPTGLEAQLMETNAGDIYIIGGAQTAEHAAARAKAIATAGADEAAVKQAQNSRRLPRQKESSEKASGEWNTYEIICAGDTLTLLVNGVPQNRSTKATVSEGHIALQSEGAPIEFRNVTIAPLP